MAIPLAPRGAVPRGPRCRVRRPAPPAALRRGAAARCAALGPAAAAAGDAGGAAGSATRGTLGGRGKDGKGRRKVGEMKLI